MKTLLEIGEYLIKKLHKNKTFELPQQKNLLLFVQFAINT